MQALKTLGLIIAAIVVAACVTLGASIVATNSQTDQQQDTLAPFYDVPSVVPPGPMGSIIRSEEMTGLALTGAKAYRVLYKTEKFDQAPTISSGMLFIPTAPAPPGGRKVISWAHPTVGMGPQCAPSRGPDPLKLLTWVQQMIQSNWIVTATDYAGLGTAGIEYYLVGQSEAMDTINAVRMAQAFPGSAASNQYGAYGHSQGGHTVLFVGEISKTYAPELKLVGVAAAAPAAELAALVDQQWNETVGWVIGPEVLISWPAAYPSAKADQVASTVGLAEYQGVASKCLQGAGIEGMLRNQVLGQSVFRTNPVNVPQWSAVAAAQTPKPLPKSVPVLLAQSTSDGVVLANTNALLEQKWCAAGSTLEVDWLGPLASTGVATHEATGSVAGPLAATWFQQRFNGTSATSTCGTTPAVPPYVASN